MVEWLAKLFGGSKAAPPGQLPPIKPGLSRAQYLAEQAKRRHVSTQWLKELGYVVVPDKADPSGWRLLEPAVSEEQSDAARAALAEIFAESRRLPTGGLDIPVDAHLRILRELRPWLDT